MPRYALKIEYKGTGYAGWQRQDGPPTVQAGIEGAILKLDPNASAIAGAGRTDAGVHALGQVAHVDLQKNLDPQRVMGAVNYHLRDKNISIVDCNKTADDWHARFSAIERKYVFRVIARRAPVTHDANSVWQIGHELDENLMQKAAEYLIGKHDFTTFRSTMCQAQSPVKTIDEIKVSKLPYPHGCEYRFHIRARSFLHNQVRSIVGTLERVGAGAWAPERVQEALEAADRAACGPVAPPDGLYLRAVIYPDDPFAAVHV